MIVQRFLRLFLFVLLLFFNWITDVHSAAGSSVFTNSMKFKNPRLEKPVNSWKNDGETDDDGGK